MDPPVRSLESFKFHGKSLNPPPNEWEQCSTSEMQTAFLLDKLRRCKHTRIRRILSTAKIERLYESNPNWRNEPSIETHSWHPRATTLTYHIVGKGKPAGTASPGSVQACSNCRVGRGPALKCVVVVGVKVGCTNCAFKQKSNCGRKSEARQLWDERNDDATGNEGVRKNEGTRGVEDPGKFGHTEGSRHAAGAENLEGSGYDAGSEDTGGSENAGESRHARKAKYAERYENARRSKLAKNAEASGYDGGSEDTGGSESAERCEDTERYQKTDEGIKQRSSINRLALKRGRSDSPPQQEKNKKNKLD